MMRMIMTMGKSNLFQYDFESIKPVIISRCTILLLFYLTVPFTARSLELLKI